ncbi:YafY family protein [Butyrivibrio sp. INlla16]|uniref:helix-turn-helix transcriptional regulator n=1 Tax=Butyrivibrio sp. INlla16 TaxID=1520807 RepID=UPI00088E16DB|nr:WYL domain-containing protein [Butyrivibrio sp. INlla16]SDB66110.1 Predicted DNA-binding transcriptional regulator YafY, contains an HTH and WYL domains [Butyrivibrio sp. INlla16]
MSRGTKQKLKFTYLMKIMLEKTDDDHGLTVNQIIEELKKYDVTAERKSIYSDLHDITDQFGIEIIGDKKGRETFYHIGSREFELVEVKLLIDAVQCAKFITEKKSRELIKKIKRFVSEHQAKQLQRQVFVHGRAKTQNESIYYNVDEIHNAIEHNQKLRFKYFYWQPDKSRYIANNGNYITVSPWALTWYDGDYYMLAYADFSKECRHYRVDKILSPQVIDEKREGEEKFKNLDMAAYYKATFGMFSGEKKHVKIQLHNKMAGVFIDRFGEDITLKPIDEKHSELNVDVFVSSQFYGWIFGLGDYVQIVGPDEVVEEMKERAKKLLEIMN